MRVELDRDVAAWLVATALDHLWTADQAMGCCHWCCAPCSALERLLDTGQLDDLQRERGPGTSTWDEAFNQVDREFLKRAWRMTNCHGGEEDPERRVEPALVEGPVRPAEMWAVTRGEYNDFNLVAAFADRAKAEEALAAGMGDHVVPYWWLESDAAAAGGPGVYGLTGGAGTAVTTGAAVGGNEDGAVAVDITHMVGNDSPGWVALHGRVRVEGFHLDRDESGMLTVRPGRFGSTAPPVST